MDNNTATIQFEVPETDDKNALQLLAGTYTASVKKIEGEQVQYQVSQFRHSGEDSKAEGENQLIFIRQAMDDGSCVWHEAFHNSRNELVQRIGREIEKEFGAQ